MHQRPPLVAYLYIKIADKYNFPPLAKISSDLLIIVKYPEKYYVVKH